MYENLLRSYKTGLVPPINFYRTRIKEPVIITRIKSSSNLLIFLGCFFFCVVSCWLHASAAFFACCSTCNVLISIHIIRVQWVAINIYSWNLPSFLSFFFFHTVDEHLENPTVINLSMVSFRNKAVSIYLALMIFNFIPANSAAWNPGVEHVFWTSELKNCLPKF